VTWSQFIVYRTKTSINIGARGTYP
jgi:hypothetical protein